MRNKPAYAFAALVFAGASLSGDGAANARDGDPPVAERWRSPLTVVARVAPDCVPADGQVRVQAPSQGFRLPPVDSRLSTGQRPYTGRFNSGMMVRLTASPGPNARFVGWSGACEHDRPQCRVIVDRARFAVAEFCRAG